MKTHRVQGIAFSSYLIETSDALFLVDSGFRWFGPLVSGKIRSLGRNFSDLRLAVLTHPHIDHVGAIPELKRLGAFSIAAHPGAVPALRDGGRVYSPPTQLWTRAVEWLATTALPLMRLPAIVPTHTPADGERLDAFGLAGTLYHTPGHSDWCVSLLLDNGVAFVGDLLVGAGHMTTRLSPPAMAVDQSRALSSVRKLLAAGAKRFMPAHGKAFDAEDAQAMLLRLGAAGSAD
jgi:glyoxylase-like metal-dependent hydrolase (beta-lactamase superfamily II)